MADFVPIPLEDSSEKTFVPIPITPDDGKQFYDDTVIGELGEGIVSGVIGIGEGLAGLGAAAVDIVADTDYGDRVTEAAEAARDALGIDPEGIIGKGAEIVTQFVVPGVGAAAKVGKLAKAARAAKGLDKTPMTKAERFSLAGKELAAAGFVDAAVSTDGMTTIGDWVDMGPTQTSDLIGLSGREKALTRLGNKLKVGAESTLLGGVAQGALMAGGKTIGQSKFGQASAKAISNKLNQTGENIDNLLFRRMIEPEKLTTLEKGAANIIAFGRYRGFLPEEVATKRELLDGQVNREIKRANRILTNLDKEIDTFVKKTPEGEGTLDRVGIMTKLESYLTEADRGVKARVLRELPKPVRNNAIRMRKHVDRLSDDVLKSNFLKENKFTLDGKNINDIVGENVNSYLRRRYKMFEDSKYVPTDESIKVADDYFRTNRSAVEKQLTAKARAEVPEFAELTDDFLNKNGLSKVDGEDGIEIKVGAKVTDEAAKKAREHFLDSYSIKAREKLGGGRVAKDKLETGMFMTRESVPKALRQLLGEIDDPREAYLGTIADLAQFTAVDDYFGTITKLANQNSGIGKLFINGNRLSPDQKSGLSKRGFVKLGGEDGASSGVQPVGRKQDEVEKLVGRSGWGSLDGYYVPTPIYNNLTRQIIAEDNFGAQSLRMLFGSFLKAKGISQYSKTVLSPITQVRNFTTATAFATANGNFPVFGRGGSLKDSAQAVFSNITNKGSDDVFADLADAQKRGVLGTNAELREIQDTLNKGLDLSARDKSFIDVVAGGGGRTREKLARGFGKKMKIFEDVYQGSDDFWKYFNYHAEQSHLRNALKNEDVIDQIAYLTKSTRDQAKTMVSRGDVDIDDLIKNRAAQIVRDTVPNYNKASSELVQFGRRLPVGNFISFPAEIYRTGFNIVRQGIDDMASDIPSIQARGRNRLLGFATTTAVVPVAALELAYATTGVSREEMDAYKRSFAPRWEKGSVLLPLGKTDDGKIEYINFSTSNPYDTLFRFTNRAINEADDAVKEGKNVGQVLDDVALGTLAEVFEPFMSEAMLTEALLDVSIRGGKTATGAEIYSNADSFGSRNSKRFAHVVDTLMPNLIPANVSGGKLEPSRFLRGIAGSEDGMISSMDKMGRERNALGEFARQVTGVSPLEFDPKRGLEYGAYRLSQTQTNAKRKFNRITDDVNAGSNQLLNAFKTANNDKLRIDKEYYQMMEDLRSMGLTDADIRRVLKKNNIGGIKGIMRGKFEPFKVTPKNFKEMRDAGIFSKYPREQIRDVQRQMKDLPLAPDDSVGVKTPAPSFVPIPIQEKPSFVPIPLQEQSSLQVPQIQPTQARAPGPVDPALLGDNPVTAALNAQIANRRG